MSNEGNAEPTENLFSADWPLGKDLYLGPTLGELLMRSVSRYSERPAMVFRGTEISYREMGHRISRIMQVLKEHGLARHSGLCLLSPNRPEAFFVRMAANLLGIRYTPLHPMGSAMDHGHILKDSESSALIFDPSFAEKVDSALTSGQVSPVLFSLGEATMGIDLLALANQKPALPLWCDAHPTDISGLTYTGGTTGRPKGVVHTHRSVVTNVLMCMAEWEWPRHIRLLAMTPLSHAAGALVIPVLLRGGTLYLHDGFDADAFLHSIEVDRITTTFLVPTMLYVLLDHARVREVDLSSLEMIIYGAAPMSPSRLVEALNIFGPIFLQLYAQSEAPMTVTTLNTWDHDPNNLARLASCGFPMAGVRVALLDDDGNEVATGDVGEICVRGPLVMEGYWNNAEETAKTLALDWLHTGDLARADEEGFLYIVDRKKDMIISGGFNVYPKEVEDALSQHPAVAQAAVISVPDDKWGEAVKAVVVLRPNMSASAEELIAFAKERKGPVQAPKTIDFRDAIPLTALGKPDKKALRAAYWGNTNRNVH